MVDKFDSVINSGALIPISSGKRIMRKSMNSPLAAIISVFFFWGFLAASNGIFIPFCKSHFQLSQFQSQLVDSAFYGAYFIGSLLLYITSLIVRRDVINSIGYKRTIIYGLLISIVGSLLMIPAIGSGSFVVILTALFVIALGFSFQQTSANPLVLNIGEPAKGSHRLNFAGSINSFGTTIGPIAVSMLLFGKIIASDEDKSGASIASINNLYIVLAVAFGLAATVMALTKIPKLSIEEQSGELKILRKPFMSIGFITLFLGLLFLAFAMNAGVNSEKFVFLALLAAVMIVFALVLFWQYKRLQSENRFELAAYPQLTWGMLAIFVYVGVEVTIQSNLGALLKLPEFGGYTDAQISPFISLYWGSLMIGRWTGSIGAFKLSSRQVSILSLVVPFMAFGLVLLMNQLNGADYKQFLVYAICVVVMIGATFAGAQKPAQSLLIYALLALLAVVVGLLTKGQLSVFAFISGGLYCSIMWPNIFSLATAGLGKYTSQASAFLIMMILGGAFIPPFQGWLADLYGIQASYVVAVICFAYLAWYATKVKTILKSSGVDYDKTISTAH